MAKKKTTKKGKEFTITDAVIKDLKKKLGAESIILFAHRKGCGVASAISIRGKQEAGATLVYALGSTMRTLSHEIDPMAARAAITLLMEE